MSGLPTFLSILNALNRSRNGISDFLVDLEILNYTDRFRSLCTGGSVVTHYAHIGLKCFLKTRCGLN